MKIKVQFFAGLRETFHSKEMGIELKGETNIGGLLDLLCDSRERREKIFDNGKLKPYMVILRNGRHIQHLKGLKTELAEGDNIAIFPPVAGG